MTHEEPHTEFAAKAIDFAMVFNTWAQTQVLNKPIPYRIEMSAPEGPSTGKGKQSLQHIKLIPVQGGTTIVAGTANQVEARAELRTIHHLQALHAQRFKGAPFSLDAEQYEALVPNIKGFLERQGFYVVLSAAPRAASPSTRLDLPRRGANIIWFLVAFAIAAGAVWFVLSRMRH
jgi:hypothetical protein